MKKIIYVLCLFTSICFASTIEIDYVQINGPLSDYKFCDNGTSCCDYCCSGITCIGGCYAVACCDCSNASEFSSISTKGAGSNKVGRCLGCSKQHGNYKTLADGKTKVEKRLAHSVREQCDGEKYCEFILSHKPHGHRRPISRVYKVEIGYYCKRTSGLQGTMNIFHDTFDDSADYRAAISCINSVDTTREDVKCCDPTATFKAGVCGGVTCGIIEMIFNVCPVTNTLSSILKKVFLG